MFEGYRVVSVTPAGRRRYMDLLARYLLQERGLIDQHHWWVNTEDPEDLAFLLQLEASYPDFFRLSVLPSAVPSGDKRVGRIWQWGRHTIDPNTIYIRFDDDIVFLAPGAVRQLLECRVRHPEPFLVYPSVVNNAVTSHLLQRQGTLPANLGGCTSDAFGTAFKDAGFAELLHRRFLQAARDGNLSPWTFDAWGLHFHEPVRVNCACWFGRDFAAFEGKVPAGVENFLSCTMPATLGRPNLICGKSVVAHFARAHQRIRLEETDLLDQYRSLCDLHAPRLTLKPVPTVEVCRRQWVTTPEPCRIGDVQPMKLVFASWPWDDAIREDVFLKSLCEPWEIIEFRFAMPGHPQCPAALLEEMRDRRFSHFSQVVRENLNEIVVFAEPDVQWLKPVQPLIRAALRDVDVVVPRKRFEKFEAGGGLLAVRCTPQVAEWLEGLSQGDRKGKGLDAVGRNTIASTEPPISHGFLPESFMDDDLLPHVPLEEAVAYQSTRSLPHSPRESTAEVKIAQHRRIHDRLHSPAARLDRDVALESLVNQPLVLGRISQNGNVVMENIGKLTLEPGGGIQGRKMNNESIWLIMNGNLNFCQADGSATTVFDRVTTIRGVAVHSGIGGQKSAPYFLSSYRPLGQCARIVYVVASHVRYGKALEQLLPQLAAAGVEADELWVVVAGAAEPRDRTHDGVHFSDVTENAFEYTALLEMARRELSYDYVFLLHDTCHVRPRFKRLVEEQPGAIPVDYMSAASHGQFNIGLYRLEFLVSHLDLWRSWDGMTKARAIDIELNRGGCGLKSLAGVTSNFFNSMPIKTGLQQPYGASDRWGAWLAGADIHKFYGAGIAGPRQA